MPRPVIELIPESLARDALILPLTVCGSVLAVAFVGPARSRACVGDSGSS